MKNAITDEIQLEVEPVIYCPQRAESGKSYLMTVDLRPVINTLAEWPYELEEYAVYCHVMGSECIAVKPRGDKAIIVHRFGGTYGPAEFVLAVEQVTAERNCNLRIFLSNGWGIPMDPIFLPITIVPKSGSAIYPLIPDNEALKIYLSVLVSTFRNLTMRAFDIRGSNSTNEQKPLSLDQVYVELNTTTPSLLTEGNSPPLTVLEATIRSKRLVLLSDPGSGKSTFLNYLALCFAKHGLEPTQGWLEQCLPAWPHNEANLVPILVTLHDFAAHPSPLNPHEPTLLLNFIFQELEKQNLGFVKEPLEYQLNLGHALILLDGLDEVSKQEARNWVRDAVQAFINRYAQCWVVVTCRTLAYQNPSWHLDNLATFTIASFDITKIDHFIEAWYNELEKLQRVRTQDILQLKESLQKEVRQPGLRQLSPNPLLLTVMAQLHAFNGRLPDNRTELYKEAVELLLSRWDEVRGVHTLSELLKEVKRNAHDLERVLWRIAYTVHDRGAQSQSKNIADISTTTVTADISAMELLNEFVKLHRYEDRDWAIKLIELIQLRAGLLIERAPGVYTFVHRTFQEYLAGAYLATEGGYKIAQEVLRLSQDRATWREVILLAVGRLYHILGDVATPILLASELCPKRKPRSRQEWEQVWLAGEILENIGAYRAQELEVGRELLPRAVKRLVDLLHHPLFTPVERAVVGRTLGNIGDPRPGLGVRKGLPEIAWCEVPKGSFQMGGDRLVARGYWEGEILDLPYAYQISKYPVTYVQFEPFVKAKGYDNEQYWTKAGWTWRQANHISQPAYWDDSDYHIANHPVVGLSWYECFAYTQWVSEQLGCVIRLPTEAEWEKAARYPDGRYFPWGNAPVSGAANVDETYERKRFDTGAVDQQVQIGPHHLDRTTAVGQYAQHASTLGLCDLSGNVWEWLLSAQTSLLNAKYNHQLPEEVRVEGEGRRQMRGGSWKNDIARARLAYRASNPPISQDPTDGFRLVRDARFNVDKWRQLQQAVPPIVELTSTVRTRGTITQFENGYGQINVQTGAELSFQASDVVGAIAHQTLHKEDIVTFEVDSATPYQARKVKRLFTGIVRHWDKEASFGFISFREDEGNEIYLYMHQNDIGRTEDWMGMKESGDQVEFEVDDTILYGEKIPEARSIRIIG